MPAVCCTCVIRVTESPRPWFSLVHAVVFPEKDLLVNQVAELKRVCEALLLSQMQVRVWIDTSSVRNIGGKYPPTIHKAWLST